MIGAATVRGPGSGVRGRSAAIGPRTSDSRLRTRGISHSAVGVGTVHHRRHGAVTHAFAYRVGWWCLDLAEGPALFDRGWWAGWRQPGLVRFHRPDFLAGADDLATAVRDLVEGRAGFRPAGRIRLLTNPRGLGIVFNPVSFYLCEDPTGAVEAIVAEITNTPWNERHAYVLTTRPGAGSGAMAALPGATPERQTYVFPKVFHVSPFQGMDHVYRWTFSFAPDGNRIAIAMANHQAGREVFAADLTLALRPATPAAIFRHAVSWPAMGAVALLAIHVQALRLWWKRAPFFTHPSARPDVAIAGGDRAAALSPSSTASAA